MLIPKFTPLVCAAAAIAWWSFFQWLRHRSYRRHIHVRITPSTQLLAWTATLGALAFAVAGLVLAAVLKSQ